MLAQRSSLLALAALLALPSAASAVGTWTSQDFVRLSVSWKTDNGKAVLATAFKLTQTVVAAKTSDGATCSTNFEQDPTQVECPVRNAASGIVDITVQSPVACADSFGHRVSEGQILVDQQPIVSGNLCGPATGRPTSSPASARAAART